MSLKIGIVGLPNVGKSTLFNALVKGSHAESANYPFCTIEPNIGIVEVPDERLAKLAKIEKSVKIVPAVVEFVDIAGLVKGASKGEGLGNKFLAAIRECDAIAQVVRFFEDENITHVANKVSPTDDIYTIETELQLADIATVEKRLESAKKELKTNKEMADLISALEKIKTLLYAGQNAREASLNEKETKQVKLLELMTMKPVLYIANCSEDQLKSFNDDKFIPISAKIESELNELDDAEKKEYLAELGLETSGLEKLIKEAYKTLGLISYLTAGVQETRAWTIHEGWTAPQAAGVIHGDFERGFIAAETIKYTDFVANNGWAGCRPKGLVKTQGKEYVMHDGDIVLFRFNV
ncbi:MAG: redox-regulated ATPase YchF [Candidatus Berkelbacteria bacterium]